MISLFTRQVPPCQPYFRVVDKDWAGGLVTAHAAYPFSSPAPSSPPVAWGGPEAYAKVTSRAQHLESIADADPPGPASCFSGTPELRGRGSANDSERHDVPTTRFLHTTTPRPAERPHGARGADPPQRRRHPDSSGRQGLSPRRVPAGHRSQDPQATEHRGEYRHGCDPRGERPRGPGRADAVVHAPLCEPLGARGWRTAPAHRRPRDAARLRARGAATGHARGERLGGMSRSGGRGAAVDAAGYGRTAVRQRRLRGEGRGAAGRVARGDPLREGGGRHRPRRVHFLADRPMSAAPPTAAPPTGPVSRIDPATAS